MKNLNRLVFLSTMLVAFAVPVTGYCSVESSLSAVQYKIINVILPLAGALGLAFAGLSFFTGNPSARAHLGLAMLGAAVGFGAPSIIDFIRSVIN